MTSRVPPLHCSDVNPVDLRDKLCPTNGPAERAVSHLYTAVTSTLAQPVDLRDKL